ncbi:hypothetical protein HYX12_00465 [Candidatus Woesearchaeota archaeon]|nr:hypothetical protein [Candidatus Woesearchaeota archaeon]
MVISLLSTEVLGESFGESLITATPIDNTISPAEQASYYLEITNKEAKTVRYSLYSLQSGQGWSVDPSPLKDRIIEVNPGQSYTTKIVIDPSESFLPVIYYVYLTIESDTGSRYDEPLKIYLSPEKPLEYLPFFSVDVDMQGKIDPREPVSIKLFLENKNPLNLSDLTVRMDSQLSGFDKELVIDLLPLEKKTVEFTVMPSPYQQPKEYNLFFIFERKGQKVNIVEQKLEVIELVPDFSQQLDSETIYLKKFLQVTVKNEGNVLNTQEVKLPVSFLTQFIIQGKVTFKIIEGKRYAVWEETLNPGESTTIQFIMNYRLFIYFGFVVLFFFVFYLSVRSSVKVTKGAAITKSSDEGAVSEIKVTLEVRNKSRKQLKEIEVIDTLPGITHLDNKNIETGTLTPQKVLHTQHGTKVHWNLPELEGREHRLITYTVKAKLNILGALNLPRAIVAYKKGKRMQRAYSNIFRLS